MKIGITADCPLADQNPAIKASFELAVIGSYGIVFNLHRKTNSFYFCKIQSTYIDIYKHVRTLTSMNDAHKQTLPLVTRTSKDHKHVYNDACMQILLI